MKSNELEEQLRQLGADWPRDPRFVGQVLNRISETESHTTEVKSVSPKGMSMIKISFASLVATAVCVALLFCLPFLSSPEVASAESILTQIRNVLADQDSIHIKHYGRHPETGEEGTYDSWFVRGTGFTSRSDSELLIDNGTYKWTRDLSTKIAYRTKTDNYYDRMFKDKLELPDSEYTRREDEDIEVNGEKLACYEVLNLAPYSSGPQRAYLFVDSQKRIKITKSWVSIEDKWQLASEMTLSYDVEVDLSLFEPDFDDSITVIDLDQMVEKWVGLDDCLFQKQIADSVYAAHRIQLLEGGGIAMLVSLRRSENSTGSLVASLSPIDPYNASPHHQFIELEMGKMYHGDISVRWYALAPRNGRRIWEEASKDKIAIEDTITLFGDLSGGNQVQRIQVNLEFSAAELESPITLAEAAAQVYRDQEKMREIPSRSLDMGFHLENEQNVRFSSSIKKTSQDDYRKAVVGHLAYWENFDAERDRKNIERRVSSGTAEIRLPGISVSGLSSFGDEDLERASRRSDIVVVNATGTGISDAGLMHLESLEHLEYLLISRTSISDAGLKHLESIASLRRLDVRKTQVTHAGIERLKAALPQLAIESDFAE